MVTVSGSTIQTQPPLQAVPGVVLPKQRPVFLDILSIDSFRYLWMSNGLSFMGMRVRDMITAWLVLEMTGSGLWVGLVNGLPAISIIVFSLLGGVMADRTDRRVLLLWSRLALASLTFMSAFLVMTGMIQLWHLTIIVILAVGVNAQDMSVSRIFLMDIVGKDRLLSATSLTSVLMDIGIIVGPFVAGVITADLGTDAALFLLGGVYLVAFASVLFIKNTSNTNDKKQTRVLKDLLEGLSYIRRTPQVAWLVSLSATVPMAGVFFFTMSIYAQDVLQVGSQGLGIIIATYGAGALVGSLYMTARDKINHKSLVVLLSALVYAGGMAVFALSGEMYISLAAAFFVGVSSTFWKNTTSTMVQTSTADDMRGRVMSVFGMGVQMLALGWLLGGILATLIGNQGTLLIASALMAGLNLFVYLKTRGIAQAE